MSDNGVFYDCINEGLSMGTARYYFDDYGEEATIIFYNDCLGDDDNFSLNYATLSYNDL